MAIDYAQAVTTLSNSRNAYDTARQDTGGFVWKGGPDGNISQDDLKAVAANPSKYSASEVAAAQYFLDHPDLAGRVGASSGPGLGASIQFDDLDAAQQDPFFGADGSGTFQSKAPSVPGNDGSDAQQAARGVIQERDRISPMEAKTGPLNQDKQKFVDALKDHAGDAQWTRDFLRALGSDESSRQLNQALATPGESRDAARAAIQSLQDNGMLNLSDLNQSHVGSTTDSSTLGQTIDADRTQQAIDQKQANWSGTGIAAPDDTSPYDAHDAFLTATSPQNKAQIEQTAQKYGISPTLLAGTLASEMDFDQDGKDVVQDGVVRNFGIGADWGAGGVGVTNVHQSALNWAVQYMKDNDLPGAADAQKFQQLPAADRADMPNAVEGAAIVLAALKDVKEKNGGTVSTPQDMATMWGAYRTGIQGVMPEATGFPSAQDFAQNRVPDAANASNPSGDPSIAMGGNANQSLPYFENLRGYFTS